MGESSTQKEITTSKEMKASVPPTGQKARNIVLDIAKGVLILLMVIGHAGAPQWLENCIYSFHMPCFFMISGILFSYLYLDKPKDFIRKRIRSIWWPFVKWTWIFLFLHNLFYNIGFYTEHYSIEKIIYKIFTIFFLLDFEQLLGGFWFLSALFIASIFCFCYYKFIGHTRIKLLIGLISLVILAEILTITNFHFVYFQPINILACAYFMCGTLLNEFKVTEKRYRYLLITSCVLLIGISSIGEKVEMGNLNSVILVPYFIKSVVISAGFIIILENFQYKSWNKYFIYLGLKTMDILIIHFLAFRIVSFLKIYLYGMDIENLNKFPVIEENNSLFWIVYVILGLIICLSYSQIKKYVQEWWSLLISRKKTNLII